MDHQRKEELKKNDLADVIEAKLVELKPYAGTIGIVALLLVAVVAGVVWMVVSRQNKAEQAWTDLYSANYQAQLTSSPKLLEQTASKKETEKTLPGLWARIFAADFHLNEGLGLLSRDREGGMEKIEQARDEFKFVSENSDKGAQQLLWSRATYGMARASEAIGEFDSATEAYEQIVTTMEGTSLAEAAAKKIEVLADPATVEWYNVFKDYKPADRTTETGDAPGSDSGLPARPDFSFPEIKVPNPGEVSGDEPPAPADSTDDSGKETANGDASPGEESPPAPPEPDGEEKAREEKASEEKASEGAADASKDAAGPSKDSADVKQDAPAE